MDTSRNAIRTLTFMALGGGLLANVFIGKAPLGIGMALWMAILFGAVLITLSRDLNRATRGILLALMCSGILLIWRDALPLKICWVLLVIALLGWLYLLRRDSALFHTRLGEYGMGLLNLVAGIKTMLLQLLQGVELVFFKANRNQAARWATAIGISAGLLLLFGSLLLSADVGFRKYIIRIADIDWAALTPHFFVFLGATLFTAHVLFCQVHTSYHEELPAGKLPKATLGLVEMVLPFCTVNLLFLGFLMFQAGYIFGGEQYIRDTADITLAEYARHGFFELIAVAALVLVLQLTFDWLLEEAGILTRRIFHFLAVFQLVLVALLLASAANRMLLYVDGYGLTRLRLYATAGMGWIGLMLCWHGLTVLRDHRHQFAGGAFFAAVIMLVVVAFLNPDAFIMRVNTTRWEAGKSFDADYACQLGLEATPALVRIVTKLPESDQDTIRRRLEHTAQTLYATPWQGWNWGRYQAYRALGPYTDILVQPAYHYEVPETSIAVPGTAQGSRRAESHSRNQ